MADNLILGITIGATVGSGVRRALSSVEERSRRVGDALARANKRADRHRQELRRLRAEQARTVARRPGDRAGEHPGQAPVAGGTPAVAARPRAEPRMTPLTDSRDALQLMPTIAGGCSGPARQTTTTPAEGRRGAAPTPCTGTPRTTPPARPS